LPFHQAAPLATYLLAYMSRDRVFWGCLAELRYCAAGMQYRPLGLPLECDLYFAPTQTSAGYANLAREHRHIVT